MKKDIFEATYEKVQEAKRVYHETGNKEEGKKLYAEATEWLKEIDNIEYSLWEAYEEARELGNEHIDIKDNIRDENVATWVKAMRECGIKGFTFSSGWSSAVETAWLFQKEGCTLEGLVELNSHHKVFMSDEYEKVHGYLFKVN